MSMKSFPEVTQRAARRRLLLAIATTGAASQAHRLLPDEWGRPVIQSVLLPAHAQTSVAPPTDQCPSTPIASTPGTIAARTENEPPEDFDSVDINFDGCDNLTLVDTDSDEGLRGPDVDVILSLDVDPWGNDTGSSEFETFDVTHLGGPRWNVESDDFGGDSDLPGGTYTLTVERTAGGNIGRRFEIVLTVTVTTVDSEHQQIELSGVTATPL